MSLILLGKRKLSDIQSHERDTRSFLRLRCNSCNTKLHLQRYADNTYTALYSFQLHCIYCKDYLDCLDKQCLVCCGPASGEVAPSLSELVSKDILSVDMPAPSLLESAPSSAEPCTAMMVSGSSSVEPVVSSGEPGTAMVVAGSASAEPGTTMLGVRTSSRRLHLKPCTISFNKQGFFQMVDIYNRFVARVHDKLFNDGSAVDGAAGGPSSVVSKFTVQELNKLKTEYDKGAAWTREEIQELCALPPIMLKAHWKDEHQLSTFREQLTKLMEHISGLQQASGKHDHEIAALRQAMAALDRVDTGSLPVDTSSVSAAAGGAGPSLAISGPAPLGYGTTVAGEGYSYISPSNIYVAAGVTPGTFMIVRNGVANTFPSTGYSRADLVAAQRAFGESTFIGYTEHDYRDMDGLPMIIRKLVWQLTANHKDSWKDRNSMRGRIRGAEDRLKKLETGHGLTRDELRTVKVNFLANKKLTDEEVKAWDNLPVILQKTFWCIADDARALKDEFSSFKRALAAPVGISVAGLDLRLKAVEAAGASAVGLDSRLKKLEAGPGYTREDFEKLKKEYDARKPWTQEERAQWDQQPLILRKLQVKLNYNNELFLERFTKLGQKTIELKQETTQLKQALATEQQTTAELKQALAAEQQATASQAQEIAALKQTLATQGQAVQGMDAHTAQIMHAVQAVVGPMRDELEELRRRVALLESARPAGACVAVKPIKKEPA